MLRRSGGRERGVVRVGGRGTSRGKRCSGREGGVVYVGDWAMEPNKIYARRLDKFPSYHCRK